MADAAMLNVVLGKHGDDDIVWGLQATVSCSEWRCSTDPHAKKRGSTIPKKYCKSSIRVLDPWGIEYSGSRSALHRKAIDSFIDSNRNGFLSLPMENMDSKLR
jgi:hypothetical protein